MSAKKMTLESKKEREFTTEQALAAAVAHLDWIGWGDRYESKCVQDDGTMDAIIAAAERGRQ